MYLEPERADISINGIVLYLLYLKETLIHCIYTVSEPDFYVSDSSCPNPPHGRVAVTCVRVTVNVSRVMCRVTVVVSVNLRPQVQPAHDVATGLPPVCPGTRDGIVSI